MKTSCHGTRSTSVSTNQQHRVLRESRGSECTVRTGGGRGGWKQGGQGVKVAAAYQERGSCEL